MGNAYTVPSTTASQVLPKIISSLQGREYKKSALPIISLLSSDFHAESERGKFKKEDSSLTLDGKKRVSLAHMVSDCERRWFQDTLSQATAGNATQQLLVAQMYHRGYGVPKDVQKGHAWFIRALEHPYLEFSEYEQRNEPDSEEMEAYMTFYRLLISAYVQVVPAHLWQIPVTPVLSLIYGRSKCYFYTISKIEVVVLPSWFVALVIDS